MSDVTIARRRGRPVDFAARRLPIARVSFGSLWVCLGVASVGAVAAAAVCLPLPHGRSVSAPELRLSIAPDLPVPADIDVAETWRDEWAQLLGRIGIGPRDAQDNAWMPAGGLSTLLATRFPSAGEVRLADREADAPPPSSLPLPPPRPGSIAHANVTRTVPVVIEPKLAALPPQPEPEPKSGGLGILDRLFADPDRNAKAVLAANPKAALYDIVKRVVYLPDGDKIEAHSGYGASMDDPNSVAIKDLGVTPPNVYAVSFREKPFHGVRALRMKPVGTGNMYGRDGILAHSYLLGVEGGSNGCVSVKDYDKFLQAYEDGKFDRIIVLRSADEPQPAQVASAQGT